MSEIGDEISIIFVNHIPNQDMAASIFLLSKQFLEMACSYDFLERLPKDLSVKIFMGLYHTGNLTVCCGVSKSWRRFVIENGLCKKFCLYLRPEASKIAGVVEVLDRPERVCRSETLRIDEVLERNHRAFSLLGIYLATFRYSGEIKERISASSYGRVPDEEVSSEDEDFDYSPVDDENPTYWSSSGQNDPTIPETVVYKTIRNLCVIKQIHVQPFEANYEPEFPVYCAKGIRFSFGCRSPFKKEKTSHFKYYDDDMFIWTYTSPAFPMVQHCEGVQEFHLPRAVFCIGGYIKIEFLGRVKKNNFDGLYYVSVVEVEAVGQYVCRMFDVDIIDDTGNCILKCDWKHCYGTPEIAQKEYCKC